MNAEEAAYQDMCNGLAYKEQQGNADPAEHMTVKMKMFRVKYAVIHQRTFWVPDQETIESVLSGVNACKILEIEELEDFEV